MSTASYRPFVSAGIDVSKHQLDLVIVRDSKPAGPVDSFTNDAHGHQMILDRLAEMSVDLIVLEATGGYERAVAERLASMGLPVAIVNPRPVRDYARAIGRLAKTDAIDALVIARFGAERRPEITVFPDAAKRQLDIFVGRYRQLIALRSKERVRLEHVDDQDVRASIDGLIQVLTEQINLFKDHIDRLIEANPQLRETAEQLQSVVGVGKVTSYALVADLPELGRVSRQQIAALVGVAPYNCDSGQMRGRRMIRGGRHAVRAALYMAAVAAIRSNAVIRPYYQRLREAGKPFKVAIVACMRKLLIHLNTLVRNLHSSPSTT